MCVCTRKLCILKNTIIELLIFRKNENNPNICEKESDNLIMAHFHKGKLWNGQKDETDLCAAWKEHLKNTEWKIKLQNSVCTQTPLGQGCATVQLCHLVLSLEGSAAGTYLPDSFPCCTFGSTAHSHPSPRSLQAAFSQQSNQTFSAQHGTPLIGNVWSKSPHWLGQNILRTALQVEALFPVTLHRVCLLLLPRPFAPHQAFCPDLLHICFCLVVFYLKDPNGPQKTQPATNTL